MIKKQIGIIILGFLVQFKSVAAENMYSIVSLGYSGVEFPEHSNQGLAYKLAFGFQIDPQWYLEAGYQQLVHDNLYVGRLPTAADVVDSENLQQGDALFLAALGKASGPTGELFYRIGILKTDMRGQQLYAGEQTCIQGQASLVNVESVGVSTICDYDEGGVAGVIGLGYDFFIGARSMVRAEMEYIKGQDNLSLTAGFIGFRYNF
ncbi:outer membrane beta-barrel protein [Paraglaciecola aestuariivivens]